jgi:hypothetical protein
MAACLRGLVRSRCVARPISPLSDKLLSVGSLGPWESRVSFESAVGDAQPVAEQEDARGPHLQSI